MNIVPRTTTAVKNIAFMCHEDDVKWKDDLKDHLVVMRREGLISIIEQSTEMPYLDIIIVIMSPKFMGDDKLINAVDYALSHRNGDQRIISVLVRKTNLTGHRLEKVQGLPRNGKPVAQQNKDDAFAEIAGEIRQIVMG